MQNTIDLSPDAILDMAAESISATLSQARAALKELEQPPTEDTDGKWASRYHVALQRELVRLSNFSEEFTEAVNHGEMDETKAASCKASIIEALSLLQNASRLADLRAKTTPVRKTYEGPLDDAALANMTPELADLCNDVIATLARLESLAGQMPQVTHADLDDIAYHFEDDLDLVEVMRSAVSTWQANGTVTPEATAALNAQISLYQDGCHLVIRAVEQARPYTIEANLDLFRSLKLALTKPKQGTH